MRYQSVLDRIRTQQYSRSDLLKLRTNAQSKVEGGDDAAQAVVDEIDGTIPSDQRYIFMGFCPGASFDNRLDTAWKADGICTFTFHESEHQQARFNDIWPGDLILLKKRHEFGKTMRLYGHGRVRAVRYNETGERYLAMEWSEQDDVIEVPLMGCNSTVDIKTPEQVHDEMPESFYSWIKK